MGANHVFGDSNKLFRNHKSSIAIAWILRIFLISFGIYEIIVGYAVFGIVIILAVFLILLPAIWTCQHIFVPLEIEILLLIVVILEYVIANSMGFYANYVYYDKFQHTMIPAITSFAGMLLIYIGYLTGKFKASYAMSWIIIVLVTIGLGTILEVIEYAYDMVMGPVTNFVISHGALTQGSPILSPYHDTMTDLIMDIVGALMGATLGVWLLLRHKKEGKKSLLDEEVEEMEDYLSKNKK